MTELGRSQSAKLSRDAALQDLEKGRERIDELEMVRVMRRFDKEHPEHRPWEEIVAEVRK